MRRQPNAARRSVAFTFKIVCRSGALSFGAYGDFLRTVLIAKQEKARWAAMLPSSTLRVQLLYPNGERVSKQDIRAALNALANPCVAAAVSARLVASADVPPTAQARTERTADVTSDFAAASTSVFCQAGVVAPPDSLTGETSAVPGVVELTA